MQLLHEVKSPVISVITCSKEYNSELIQTLRSVKSQVNVNIESICVFPRNYIMRPNEISRLESIGLKKFKVVNQDKEGIYNAMNFGIIVSSGEFCLFLNSADTFYEENSLAHLLVELGKERFGYGSSILVKRTSKGIFERNYQFMPFNRFLFLTSSRFVPHCSTIYTRELLIKLGGFRQDVGISADQELFYRALKKGNPQVSRIVVSKFFLGGTSSRSSLAIAREYAKWIGSEKIIGFCSSRLNFVLLFLVAVLRSGRNIFFKIG